MHRLKPWQTAVTLVALFAGLLLVVNLKTRMATATPAKNNDSVVLKIKENEKAILKYEQEIAKTRQELDEFQKSKTQGRDNLQGLQKRLDEARLKAGLMPVEGPGIVFTLDDRNQALELAKKSGEEIDYWDYLVHDSDVLHLVNELKAVGAEAISLNDERIVSSSDIKCGGFILFTNGTRLGAPYIIKALGEPALLEKTLKEGPTYAGLVGRDYPITLKKEDKIYIPAYRSPISMKYGKIVKEAN
ncbi:MAG: DUF881 domain-containing protein [Clostridia bacterium]|nr:DUF881 domain-containing protein [Clostridia bacterium]